MGKKRNKQNFIGRIIFSQYFLTFLGLAILTLISFPLAKNIGQRDKVDSDIGDLQKEIENVENKNSGLKKVLDYMDSSQFTEEQARLKFGLKKPGEEVVAIKNGNTDNSIDNNKPSNNKVFTITGLEKNIDKPISNPQKWFKYFFEKSK